jgi:hypothetical protein
MNTLYDSARYRLNTGAQDWRITDLVLSAWHGGLPPFHPTDVTINAIKLRGGVEVASSLPIAGHTVASDGTAQTYEVLIPTVPSGPDVTFLTMSKRNATIHDNSELIMFIDEGLGIPFTPNGLDVLITPDWLQNRGWFRP